MQSSGEASDKPHFVTASQRLPPTHSTRLPPSTEPFDRDNGGGGDPYLAMGSLQ